ncbi:MAG: NEW3 domain-containing protein [Desulfobacterales bacterium]|nr:NEW3 domain-containing protein [Desulfobacterales bacterium]
MHHNKLIQKALIVFMVSAGLLLSQGFRPVDAKDKTDDEKKPERLIVMAAEYPGVVVPADENVSIDLTFFNKGRSDESVDVWVAEKPKGWEARIKTYKFTVTGIHVPSGEDKRLTFEADPGKETKPGKYEFLVEAQTRDGQFKMSQTIMVEVKAKDVAKKEDKGVKLNTSYPVLQGPTDAKFEFSVEVDSKLDKDAVFNLFVQGPDGWDINFKPAYEDKYISSLRIKAGQSETVAVVVKPAASAKAGEYPINVRVATSEANGEVKLNVVLTGTFELEVGTASGLLSLDTRQGKPANMSFYIKNNGSAPNSNVKFMTFKPENWKVAFNPEKIDVIEPGKLQQVEVTITPNEEALVGDYSVNVKVDGEKASKTLEFRVTVKASSAWGWVGIGIIVAVIAGLIGLFRWLGRR